MSAYNFFLSLLRTFIFSLKKSTLPLLFGLSKLPALVHLCSGAITKENKGYLNKKTEQQGQSIWQSRWLLVTHRQDIHPEWIHWTKDDLCPARDRADFIMILRAVHNLKLMNYFYNFPFHSCGSWWSVGNKLWKGKTQKKGTTVQRPEWQVRRGQPSKH